MELPISQVAYPNPESQWRFYGELQERIESLPGVRSSGAVSLLPLAGGLFTSPFAYDAASEQDFGTMSADYRSVTPGYFETMEARLLSGRSFSTKESVSGRRVVVIDDTLAKLAWPNESPIGKRVKIDLAAVESLMVDLLIAQRGTQGI